MDEAKLNEFMGKLVVDMGGAAIMANVILGEELGLYRAMADGHPVTPDATRRAHQLQRPARARVAQRPRGERLRRTRPGPVQAARRAGHGAGARGLAGLRGRRSGRACQHVLRQGQGGQRHARRRRAVVGRSPSVPLLRHRALLPARLSSPPGQRMAAGARRRGGQARAGRQSRRHRLRSWRVHRDHGEGVSEFALPRIRLSRPLDRQASPARGGSRCRGSGRSSPRPLHAISRAAISIWSASSTACTTWATRWARPSARTRR